MKRISQAPRADWQEKAEAVGFTYHSLGESPTDASGVCWFEGAAYEFTSIEVDLLEAATAELHQMCLTAVGYAVDHPEEMDAFCIPGNYRDFISRSWRRRDPYWMGRFDLAYEPESATVKLLEYNADTPTLVIETALVQWFWLQDTIPDADQFNSLHEALLSRIKEIGGQIPAGETLHFAGLLDWPEEGQHIRYFMDLAQQAGIKTASIQMADIGWVTGKGLVDLNNGAVRFLHKLYPWEWLAVEPFGGYLPRLDIGIIEPPWKMLLSNKAILPLLWRLFPGHPLLLPAGWSQDDVGQHYIRKPILGREGANMELCSGDRSVVTDGSYGNSPMVYQEAAKLPVFDGQHVVLGSWIVGERPAGLIVRESEGPIVVNTSRVVPHFFREVRSA